MSNIREFYIGEKRWLKINISNLLEDGAEIASVAWTPESPVTMVGGSSTIYTRNTANDSVKALFDFASTVPGTRYSITATMTTDEGEEIKETIIVTIKALPE